MQAGQFPVDALLRSKGAKWLGFEQKCTVMPPALACWLHDKTWQLGNIAIPSLLQFSRDCVKQKRTSPAQVALLYPSLSNSSPGGRTDLRGWLMQAQEHAEQHAQALLQAGSVCP